MNPASAAALASNFSALASSQPYSSDMLPVTATVLQPLTLPAASIARLITSRPSSVSPVATAAAPGRLGSNLRSKVIVETSPLAPSFAGVAPSAPPTTLHGFEALLAVLDSYLHDCVFPSASMVTVIFSHQAPIGRAAPDVTVLGSIAGAVGARASAAINPSISTGSFDRQKAAVVTPPLPKA